MSDTLLDELRGLEVKLHHQGGACRPWQHSPLAGPMGPAWYVALPGVLPQPWPDMQAGVRAVKTIEGALR